MDKALEAGLKRYPEKIIGTEKRPIDSNAPIDANLGKRILFMEGYKEAEKDLSLTWEDIKMLFKIADNYESELNRPKYLTQCYCEEVLRRFNEARNG